jgi:hypothetical protein
MFTTENTERTEGEKVGGKRGFTTAPLQVDRATAEARKANCQGEEVHHRGRRGHRGGEGGRKRGSPQNPYGGTAQLRPGRQMVRTQRRKGG